MERQIPIPELEPVLAAKLAQGRHEVPGLLGPAPAAFAVRDTAERVENRVDVRRDAQAEMLEVVARVDDDDELPGFEDIVEAERKLGAADSAAECEDLPAHRNMSVSFDRMSADAGTRSV